MAQAFGFAAAGTGAAGAIVEVVTIPATLTCRDCRTATETTDLLAVCPRCGSVNVELAGGGELVLDSVRHARTTAR